MFAAMSTLSIVIIVCVLLFIFRRNITTFNQIAPESVEHLLVSAAAATSYLEDLTLTNVSEQKLELQQRAAAIEQALQTTPAVNLRALHAKVSGYTTK